MNVALILFVGGLVVTAWLYFWTRQHAPIHQLNEIEQSLKDIPLASSNEAVLVSREHGQLIYANSSARSWLGMNGGDPNLEQVARLAQPSDNFLGLFAGEGQTSFQLGNRWVEASSIRLPGTEMRTVVVMREIAANTNNPDALDLSKAMRIINQIGELTDPSNGVETTLQVLLSILHQAVEFDAGEINLRDGNSDSFRPRGWFGDASYLVQLDLAGGAYHLNEGVTGWIAQHRKPLLLTTRDEMESVRPKVPNSPFETILGVPLALGDNFIGTLEIASKQRQRFGQAEVALLQAVSKPVTTAIYNAMLYAEQVKRIEDITSLQQNVERAASTSAIEASPSTQVYASLTEHIANLIDAEMCGVLIYDDVRQELVGQTPFFGLPEALVRRITIPVPPDSPQHDIWENQPHWIANEVADEPLVEALGLKSVVEVAGIRNTAWIPMQISERRIGVLAISNRRGSGFTPRDIQYMRVLASQAAIVVENVRLYGRERRLDAELAGLQEMTYAIGELNRESQFFGVISERVARLMNASVCGILLYDEDEHRLVSQIPFYGVDDAAIIDYVIDVKPGTAFEELWAEDAVWYTNQADRHALVFATGMDKFANRANVEKILIAPLSVGGQRLGILLVANRPDGHNFDDSDERLAKIFATQAATIIENSRLLQEIQRSSERAQRLRRIAELSGAIVSLEEGGIDLLHEISGLLDSPLVFVNVFDQETASLVTYPRWVYGIDLAQPIVQDPYTKGFDQSVVMSRQPLITDDALDDSRLLSGYRQLAVRFGLQAALIVPLIVGDRCLGELGVANRGEPYHNEDLDTLSTIATQIATSLDRVLLIEATGQNLVRRSEELDAISRVSNELTLTLDFDQVLEVIRKEALRATGAQGSTVVLLRPNDQWRQADQPEMDRRLGNARNMAELADIELEAITRGAEPVIVRNYDGQGMTALPVEARSAVAAAILYVDQIVGVIHLYHTEPNRFDERAAAFLMTLSTKASLGYGNAIRFQEQKERSERLRLRVEQLNRIFELGHMLHTNADQITILEAVAYSIQQSVGFDVVLMLMLDENRVLRRVAHAGLPIMSFEQDKEHTITLESLTNLLKERYKIHESYFFPVEDVNDWYQPDIKALNTQFDGNRTIEFKNPNSWRDGDMFLVSLTGQDGNLIGMISLDRPYNDERPGRATVEVLEIFAHQAATTLENTRLYLASVRNAELETRLNEILKSVSSNLDTDIIMDAVAMGTFTLIPYNRMTIALLNNEQKGFDILRVSENEDGTLETSRDRRATLQRTAMGRSFDDRQEYIYYADGHDKKLSFEDLDAWFKAGEKIGIVLPLMTGGECFGVVHIGSDSPHTTNFTQVFPIIRRMMQLFSSAIQNARLFDQAVNLRAQRESVLESIQQGIIVLDNSGRIISVNSYMRQRYGWDEDALNQDIFSYRPDIATLLKNDLRIVMETGQPQEQINQNTIEPDGRPLVRNFYIYPLRFGETVRGAVILVEDVTDRALLEQAMESRANQLGALTEVSSRITSSLEREEVVNLALEEMVWLIKYDTMTIWRRNGSYMVLEDSAGVDAVTQDAEVRIRISDYDRVRQIVETQRVVSLNLDPGIINTLPGENSARSWLGVPLVNQGHVVGMIIMTKTVPDAFESKSDQNIAFAFASQVAIALANADLFEQTFDRTNELGILLEAAQATSLTQELDSVFRIVVELMFGALDMDQCAIMIWDEVDNALEVQIDLNRQGLTERLKAKGTRYDLSKSKSKLHALREREVVVVLHDDTETPFADEWEDLKREGSAARMLVPLVVSDSAIGLIQLDQHVVDDRAMTQQKVRLARALGSQVAVAIQNARLSHQMNNLFEESLIINELSRALSSTFKEEDMIAIVRDQVPKVTGAEELYLALYDEDTQEITFPLAVKNGQEYQIPPRKLANDEVSFVIRHNRFLTIGADYFTPEELRRSLGIAETEGEYKSYLGVPLAADDQVYGVLALRDHTRTRAFDLNDQRVLTTVGAQLGVVMQNARLFRRVNHFNEELQGLVADRTQELEAERDRLDTLYQITSELSRTLDMERLLRRALGMVVKAVGGEDGVIMGLDPLTDTLYTQAALNPNDLPQDEHGNVLAHPADGLASWLIQNDHITVVEDLLKFEQWDPEAPGAAGWRSAIAVLLESNENDPQGVLVLLSHQENAFGESEMRLLEAAATQVAAAINNAELYNLIRDQAERLGTMLRVEQEEAQKNTAILESIADGVILSDAEGRVILFNASAETILAVPRDQVLGQPIAKFTSLYGDDVVGWVRVMREYMEHPDHALTGTLMDERITLGSKFVNVQVSPVYIADTLLGMVSVFRDITSDVEVDRIKSEFVSNVSHEFRTPLTSIKGYNDLLLMGAAGQVSGMQLNWLQTIKENVERLTVLVEDVLAVSKIDSGREKLKIEQVDLKKVVDNVLETLRSRPRHQRKPLDVEVKIDTELPTFQADPDKLSRILSNIVDNAFNYTPEGGNVEIGGKLEADGKRVLMWVRDTGVGIPESFRDDIWQRFKRFEEHALKLDVAGTGLGLSIVKELVEMHGGKVWFESEVDKGTTFFISLPVDQLDASGNPLRRTGTVRQVSEEHS